MRVVALALRRVCAGMAAVALAILAPPAAAEVPPELTGPDGVSHRKVLVVGLDGVRWDVLRRVIADGRAPHLDRLGREGLAGPTLLPYAPPTAATISEVGWSTIATGAGPDKHGVIGVFANNDPRQSTKNGYLDFLARAERARPELSTFLVSDWANIGQRRNGGPIFSGPIDVRHALAAADTIESYDRSDQEVADVAARYLREGDPDAGFVYLGLVDQVAHEVGSATAHYPEAIAVTDARVGQLLDAIRARPSFARERWTVIVTTDHGQRPLTYGTTLSHGLGSDLERTSFVIADGPGIRDAVTTDAPGVVDIAPTVLHQLAIPVDPAWRLDGRSFVRAAPPPPPPAATARLRIGRRGHSLAARVITVAGAPRIASVAIALPPGLSLAGAAGSRPAVQVRADGRLVGRDRLRVTRRRIQVRLRAAGAGHVVLRIPRGAVAVSRKLRRGFRRGDTLELRATIAEVGAAPLPQQVEVRVR